MEAPNAEYSPQQQAAGRGQPDGLATLIFEMTATLLMISIAQIEAIQTIANAHDAQLAASP